MARQVIVKIGGEDRELWFDARDGIAITKALGKRPKAALYDILGTVELSPDDAAAGVKAKAITGFDVDLHSLAVVLQRGLSHDHSKKDGHDPDITYDVVVNWLTQFLKSEPAIILSYAVQDAFYLSGIMGVPVDLKELAEKAKADKEADEDGTEGKAQGVILSTATHTTLSGSGGLAPIV